MQYADATAGDLHRAGAYSEAVLGPLSPKGTR
jgi:hypothetical protein